MRENKHNSKTKTCLFFYFRGSADFIGLNHYSSLLAEPAPRPNNTIYVNDDGLLYTFDPKWPSTSKGSRVGFSDLSSF